MKHIEKDLQLTSGPTPYSEVNAVLNELLSGVQTVLGDHFVGMYLGGSLASGDFNPRRSDIDFLIVTTDEIPDKTLSALQVMHERITAGGSKWARELEGSYIPQHALRRYDPTHARHPHIERYGRLVLEQHDSDWVIQRYILREHGIVLAGPTPHSLISPVSPMELRQAVLGWLLVWWAPMLDNPEFRLHSPGYRAYAVLAMCRILYTLQHGTIVAKAVAARWAQETYREPWTHVIERAFVWEQGAEPVDLSEALAFIRYTVKCSKEV